MPWREGVNAFSALTQSEFETLTAGYVSLSSRGDIDDNERGLLSGSSPTHANVHAEDLPLSLNWTAQGVVSPVKAQGRCGACWAFSAAETIESSVAIASQVLLKLSEQELVDCTPNPYGCDGLMGCSGGTQEEAYAAVMQGGIALASAYPYNATNASCPVPVPPPVAIIDGFVVLPPNNYTDVMNALVDVGPLAVSVAASTWHSYESGVYANPDCSTNISHAVQLVGYGTDNTTGLDYYLIRNSWGILWGEEGYMRLARYGSTAQGEPCGLEYSNQSTWLCGNASNATTVVCGLCGVLSHVSYPTGPMLLHRPQPHPAPPALDSLSIFLITLAPLAAVALGITILWLWWTQTIPPCRRLSFCERIAAHKTKKSATAGGAEGGEGDYSQLTGDGDSTLGNGTGAFTSVN